MKLNKFVLLLLALSISTNAFSDDINPSPEEYKRMKEENAKLKKSLYDKVNKDDLTDQPIVKVDESPSSSQQNYWGSVGAKTWKSSLDTGDGVARGAQEQLLSANVGYENIFLNVSFSFTDQNAYKGGAPIPIFDWFGAHSQVNVETSRKVISYNLGYFITPEWALTVGKKNITQEFASFTSYCSGGCAVLHTPLASPQFFIFGAVYNHKISDTSFSINGSVSYGVADITNNSASQAHLQDYIYTGSTGGKSQYFSLDIGANYMFYKNFKINAFYRFEQYENLYPSSVDWQAASLPTTNLEFNKFRLWGPGVGISYSF